MYMLHIREGITKKNLEKELLSLNPNNHKGFTLWLQIMASLNHHKILLEILIARQPVGQPTQTLHFEVPSVQRESFNKFSQLLEFTHMMLAHILCGDHRMSGCIWILCSKFWYLISPFDPHQEKAEDLIGRSKSLIKLMHQQSQLNK